jgi:hypothetical protein
MTHVLVPAFALALAATTSFAMAAPEKPAQEVAQHEPVKLTDEQLDKVTAGASPYSFSPGYGRFTAFTAGAGPIGQPAPGQGAAPGAASYGLGVGTATAGRGAPYPI